VASPGYGRRAQQRQVQQRQLLPGLLQAQAHPNQAPRVCPPALEAETPSCLAWTAAVAGSVDAPANGASRSVRGAAVRPRF